VSRRVLVVGRGAPEMGGIPSFLAMMAESGPELGCEVELLNLSPGRVTEGGRTSLSNLARTVRDTVTVLRRARRGDLVHVHSAMAPAVTAVRSGLFAAAARARGAHVVVHAHGGRVASVPAGSLTARLVVAALRPAHAVVVVSTRVLRVLVELGVDARRLTHVPNAIEVERFAGERTSHSPPRVLFVGGLTARKGVLDLARASSTLVAEGVEHELWLVGGVPDEGEDARHEVMRSLPPSARLLGERSQQEMPAVYDEADVFCLPSWWEAMPLTVLEAQASALPVVATAVGDVPAMVDDGVDGFVVPSRDATALTDALRGLLLDEGLRKTLGTAARARAESYGKHDMLARLRVVFDECGEAR
jgi:glycosyltransferase involved in cell wall biosynthesis